MKKLDNSRAALPSPSCCLWNELVPSLPQMARIFSAPPGCFVIHFVKSKTLSKTILQQLVPESCFLTSSIVSFVSPLITVALEVADFEGEGVADVL